jgi:hypothetical protein
MNTADPDRACLHPDFALFADVGRIAAYRRVAGPGR